MKKRYLELLRQAKAKVAAAEALLVEYGEAGLPEEKVAEFDSLMADANELKVRAGRLKAVLEQNEVLLDAEADEDGGDEEEAATDGKNRVGGASQKAFGAVYSMRFGQEEAAQKAVLTDIVGKDYQQRIWDQNKAFARYLRGGSEALEGDDRKLLKQQIFAFAQIERMVKEGMSVAEMKATMVEAQGTLGGFAVPPNIQQEFITRLPGLTVVRAGGARVIELINSNSVEAPEYTGGNDRYRGNLRGSWGSETQSPGSQNATLGMKAINADVYTYKITMSQSLVEDASNLVELVQADIIDTGAMDEDEAFLIGDGVGKPMGILPGGTNGLSLSEVVSGAGSALTANGIKGLKRGIASQYRARGRFVANSDTFGAIEKLRDDSGASAGTGQYLFADLSDNDMLLNRPTGESEAMPDVASNAYPLLYGDMTGYWIVQRMGMTIARFQDSNTGINSVQFHVRRRVGGRVVEPWKFAVQKVASS